VHVRLRGACASCPASVLTLKGAVERTLKGAFPEEIREVRAI
jgi:Fe-S cluster biogenesis protein NfuA